MMIYCVISNPRSIKDAIYLAKYLFEIEKNMDGLNMWEEIVNLKIWNCNFWSIDNIFYFLFGKPAMYIMNETRQ